MRNPDDAPSTHNMVKILFELDPNAWHGSAAETLWATPVEKDEYTLENVPFYVFGVSYGDRVLARLQDGIPVFKEVIRRSGHSTYRILLKKERASEFDKFWQPLREHGCTYEEGFKHLLAVDVPPHANIFEVYQLLEDGEKAEVWSFEEGHCGHPTSKEEANPER
jgi:hypothetical protein